MAWRPTRYLMEGELDNTIPGKVTGWMQFAGMDKVVTFDLVGDFHRDIRGAKIRFVGQGQKDNPAAAKYMNGLAVHQTGKVGDITAGLPPQPTPEVSASSGNCPLCRMPLEPKSAARRCAWCARTYHLECLLGEAKCPACGRAFSRR